MAERLPADRAGLRLHGQPALADMLGASGVAGRIAAEMLGHEARPVRAILFDKTAQTNWALGWHQDRTICVTTRHEVAGFGPWSVKQGLIHVEPPFALIERMATLRIHLDDVDADNAPLLVAPGSHRCGRVPEGEIDAVVQRCGVMTCLAQGGDIWAYATPILHASRAAQRPGHRRVLQVDFSAETLPAGLQWHGI